MTAQDFTDMFQFVLFLGVSLGVIFAIFNYILKK